jgi:hypothetical protein
LGRQEPSSITEENIVNLKESHITNENTPRPLLEIPKLWIQLGQMTEAFFEKEVVHASTNNTIFGLLIYSVVSALISLVPSIFRSLINSSSNPPVIRQFGFGAAVLISFLLCFGGIVTTPIFFYLNNGIYYVSALIFGGKGNFNSQTYLSSLYFAPLGIISSLSLYFTAVPKIGSYIVYLVLLGIVIFQTLFTIRLFKAVHRFTSGRAVASVLSPLLLLLIPICLIGILLFMGPGIGNVFSAINSSLNTTTP